MKIAALLTRPLRGFLNLWNRALLRRLGWSTLAAIVCGQGACHADTALSAEADVLPLIFQRLVLVHEEPRLATLRFDLDAGSRRLERKENRLRADCPRHWERHCWDETLTQSVLTPDQFLQLARALSTLKTADQAIPPRPGAAHRGLTLDFGNRRLRYAACPDHTPDTALLRVESLLIAGSRQHN